MFSYQTGNEKQTQESDDGNNHILFSQDNKTAFFTSHITNLLIAFLFRTKALESMVSEAKMGQFKENGSYVASSNRNMADIVRIEIGTVVISSSARRT